MRLRDMTDWVGWFERGTGLDHLSNERRANAAALMCWVMAHSDCQGTGWGVCGPDDCEAFGGDIGISGDAFSDALADLISARMIKATEKPSHIEYSVDFDETFEDLIP